MNNVESFKEFATLYNYLYKFNCNLDEKSAEELSNYLVVVDKLPLPSGRWGNALGVAIEMELFPAALFIMQNAEKLGINLDIVSTTIEGEEPLSLSELFLSTFVKFDINKLPNIHPLYKDHIEINDFHNRNINAAYDLYRKLFIDNIEQNIGRNN